MERSLRTLVVIPAFNEAKNIGKVIQDVRKGALYADIVVIDDGSPDHTSRVVQKWFFATCFLLILSLWPALLAKITYLIGALSANSTLFFFSLVFVMIFLLHISVKLSKFQEQIKTLLRR